MHSHYTQLWELNSFEQSSKPRTWYADSQVLSSTSSTTYQQSRALCDLSGSADPSSVFHFQFSFEIWVPSRRLEMSIGYQLFGIPIPNRYQLGIWYFKASAFGILLVLWIFTDVKEAENLVKSWYFPHIPKSVWFRYFSIDIVGIWFGIGITIFRIWHHYAILDNVTQNKGHH